MTKDKRYWQAFSGDINEYVYTIQYEDYWDTIWYIYGKAKVAYLDAEKIVGTTLLGKIISNNDSFDHRTLRSTYYKIADQFRYLFAEELLTPMFPGLIPGHDHRRYVSSKWFTFYIEELNRLIKKHPIIIKKILTATAYLYPDKR